MCMQDTLAQTCQQEATKVARSQSVRKNMSRHDTESKQWQEREQTTLFILAHDGVCPATHSLKSRTVALLVLRRDSTRQ